MESSYNTVDHKNPLMQSYRNSSTNHKRIENKLHIKGLISRIEGLIKFIDPPEKPNGVHVIIR